MSIDRDHMTVHIQSVSHLYTPNTRCVVVGVLSRHPTLPADVTSAVPHAKPGRRHTPLYPSHNHTLAVCHIPSHTALFPSQGIRQHLAGGLSVLAETRAPPRSKCCYQCSSIPPGSCSFTHPHGDRQTDRHVNPVQWIGAPSTGFFDCQAVTQVLP